MISRRLLPPVLSSLVASAALFGFSNDANACTAPACSAAMVAPPSVPSDVTHPTVPSSVKAFPLRPSRSGQGDATDAATHAPRLLDPEGKEIAVTLQDDPTTPGDKLVVPSAELAVGKDYVLEYRQNCSPDKGIEEEATPFAVKFDVSAASALPTTLGAFDLGAPVLGKKLLAWESVGTCTPDGEVSAVAVEVRIAPSAELSAFASLTRFELLVDGQPYGPSRYYGQILDATSLGSIYAACETPDAALRLADEALSPGEHTVTVRAHVAGAESDPPELTTKVTLSCIGEIPEGEDGGTTGTDGGVTEHPDASPPDSSASPDAESAGGGGCSTTGGTTGLFGSGGALLAGIALALGARGARRRPRR